MKNLLPLVFLLKLLLIPNNSQAQNTPTGVKVVGVLKDATSGEAIEFCTVAVLRKDSSIAAGKLTDENGAFVIDDLKEGIYILKIKAIGYAVKFISPLNVKADKPVFNLGVIKLESSSKSLKEVTVTGEKAVFQNSLDKKVFNVDKSIVSQGGSASDVLNQVPSVSVEIDGNISMRGNGNITVLIDGKPSSITGTSRAAILDQIPASTIDRIEIITNPSAKYDPDGMAGIINIILKKDRAPGFNGSASASVGNRNKYNASTNLSLRTKKLTINATYSYRYNDRWGEGYIDRKTKTPSDSGILIQNSNQNSLQIAHMGKISLDYDINDKNTLSIGSVLNINSNNHPETNIYNFFNKDSIFSNAYGRNALEINHSHSVDVTLDYRKTFAQPQKLWTVNLSYSGSMGKDENTISQNMYAENLIPIYSANPIQQANTNNTSNRIITLQTDFALPLSEFSKFEIGYKSVLRNVDNNFTADSLQRSNGNWINNALLTNHFIYSEGVHSAYAMYSQTIKNFSFQAGSRFEESMINSQLVNTAQNYPSNYFNLYPSLHISEKLQAEQEIMFSYSRRVNRPSFQSLNPFTDYSDPLNLRIGNPFLKPEYVNNYEIGYSKSWETTSLTASAYYKDIRGVNKMIGKLDPNNPNVVIITWENLDNGISYGFEVIGRTSIFKWWNITGSGNIYHTILSASPGDASSSSASNYSGVAKYTSNMTLWKGIMFQVSGNYNGPSVWPGGHMVGIYSMDAGIRKDFMKNKFILSLNCSDIFNQRRYIIYSYGDGFTQYVNRKRESRVLMLTLTYKFGKADLGSKKVKNSNDNKNEGGEDY